MSYIVKTSSDSIPSKFGTYRRIAVLEVEPGKTAADIAMISERARGVIAVTRTWERLNVGKTEHCAYRRALAEAEALAENLNGIAEGRN